MQKSRLPAFSTENNERSTVPACQLGSSNSMAGLLRPKLYTVINNNNKGI